MVDAAIPDFTPVHVLTGFLGSGKTTLLGRLLRDPALADTAVLINEFGEIGLDHHLVERIDETVVLLSSGCLCCTVRGELSDAIKRLLSERERGLIPPFRRLVIETTGLADPSPVLTTLAADPVLKHHVRLGTVVATVDAVNGMAQLERHPESLKQAVVADRLVLTKTDLTSLETAEATIAALRRLNPDAEVVSAVDRVIDADRLLSETAPFWPSVLGRMRCLPVGEASAPSGEPPAADHGAGVEAFSLVVAKPLDWSLFGLWLTMLLHRHGDAVLRVKGILNVDGSPTPVALHGVQQLVHVPRHLPAWPDDDRRSKIVFIVRSLDPASLRRSLEAFGTVAQDRVRV